MGIIEKVKDVMHPTHETASSHTDSLGRRSNDHDGSFQEDRARLRAEESAALSGQSNVHSNATHAAERGLVDSNSNSMTAKSTGSQSSHAHTHVNAVPQSSRQDYADVPGHGRSAKDTQIDPLGPNVTNTTTTLGHVTHENVKKHEVEEVQRLREQEKIVTHVQLHKQPILDRQVNDEVQHHRTIEPTKVHEVHSAAPGEAALLAQQVSQDRDTRVQAPTTRTVVDKGEIVNTTTHHQVHNVVQPIIEREIVDQSRIHTVIPIHEKIETAPVVHQSSVHEPISMAEFKKAGGTLGSNLDHKSVIANVIDRPTCEREVQGPADEMMAKLHIKSATPTSGTAPVV